MDNEETHQHGAQEEASPSEVERLAELVYRLMVAEARLERARGVGLAPGRR